MNSRQQRYEELEGRNAWMYRPWVAVPRPDRPLQIKFKVGDVVKIGPAEIVQRNCGDGYHSPLWGRIGIVVMSRWRHLTTPKWYEPDVSYWVAIVGDYRRDHGIEDPHIYPANCFEQELELAELPVVDHWPPEASLPLGQRVQCDRGVGVITNCGFDDGRRVYYVSLLGSDGGDAVPNMSDYPLARLDRELSIVAAEGAVG